MLYEPPYTRPYVRWCESLNLIRLAQVRLLDVCCVSYDKDEGRPLGEGCLGTLTKPLL